MTDARATRASGSCLCGAIKFAVKGPLRDVIVCHCVYCQRSCTSVGAFSACRPDDLVMLAGRAKWYSSSPLAKRGFCPRCGSQLFWAPSHGEHISISAGSLDQPTGLTVAKHDYCDQIGDFDRSQGGSNST